MPETLQRLDLSNCGVTAARGLQALTEMVGSLTDLNLRCVKVGGWDCGRIGGWVGWGGVGWEIGRRSICHRN